MAGSFSVTLVRPPGKGVGLRIKGCGTIVSQLDPQSVAARGGLLEGDTIVSINGRDCNTQKTATDHMNELKQRSTATYIVEVRRGPSAIASKRKLEEQAQLEQQATDSSPPPAVETKKKKEVQPPAPEAQPAKAAKAAKAAPTAKAPEATRLLKLLRSDAVNVKEDLVAKLKAGHQGTVSLLSELYPDSGHKKCVFCLNPFIAGAQGQCCVLCDVSWDDFEREFAGYCGRGTHIGQCTRCGQRVSVDGDEDCGPNEHEIPICYQGPHTADKQALKRHYKAESDDSNGDSESH